LQLLSLVNRTALADVGVAAGRIRSRPPRSSRIGARIAYALVARRRAAAGQIRSRSRQTRVARAARVVSFAARIAGVGAAVGVTPRVVPELVVSVLVAVTRTTNRCTATAERVAFAVTAAE